MKNTALLLLMIACITNGTNCQNAVKKKKQTFEFNDLTFYSSACNGTCPEISMNITGFRQMQVIRRIYKRKGEVDTILSGGFKGTLSEPDFNEIVEEVSKINWDTLSFPDVQCCDGPVVTILISYNNKSKNFKSMTPPSSTTKIIAYLVDLSLNVSLPRYNKPMDFEVADPPPSSGQ